ncbi:tetratricopeptide repeat protein [uncultured Flavobacterium sp.]|uniref:tetratricopeptide repeat protein n=1 Tax=uncultured Flavobacterium sp. TaxID=165435 RepID=UPI002592485B|nr:tetratricopeptide repeat protein [uncultured Flavobacterium sp.]
MNITNLTYLLNKPEATNEKQTIALENIVLQFPYFQAARALHLKGLYNQESFRYNYELKKTAAYTTDRTVLFEFITSENFIAIQQDKIDEIQKALLNIEVHQIEEIVVSPKTEIHSAEETIITKSTDEKLEIGKPLPFTPTEKHSFQEWLQLTKFAPIERNFEENQPKIDSDKQKKIDIIDKFIEANPKITPVKDITKAPANITKSDEEPTHLMTETLAKVYLEQKKYNKAIQAYEILILKYPEKSSFFADRINEIKNLQQNNN